ncbi:MAG: DUF2723 domain-containing protein [Acidobacteria bacterium]|nr:DUF2723 domain-containing protein [Acidobacteriota bacterium]
MTDSIPEREAGPSRSDRLAAAAVGAVLFAVYAFGACRTIYVGDSGELVTAVYLLGIPHPSGYPLYVLLGKLWTLIAPFGSIAFRMSLFSAAAAAGACATVYLVARRLDLARLDAAFASLLLGFSPSFWGEANIQRVYALNALFLAATTLAVVRWWSSRSRAALAVAFLLAGLGASVHLFMAVYGLCFGAAVVILEPWRRKIAGAAIGPAAFAAGVLPYLYLPIRSRADPALDWGNPETLPNFLRVVFRSDFWDRRWIEGPSDLLVIGWDYVKSFGPELGWAGAFLAVAGAVVLVSPKRRGIGLLFLAVMAANVGMMALHGSRADIFIWHRYYIPSYTLAALLAGAGACALRSRFPRRIGPALLVVPLALAVTGYREFDRSRYRISDDFSRTVLGSMPPGAHLIATDDNILFTMIYLHFVEGVRPDVDLILQGVGSADLPPLKFDPDTDPVFLTHHPNWSLKGLALVPVGLTFRAWREGRPDPPLLLPADRLAGEADPRVPREYLTQNLIGQFHYMLGITFEGRDWLRAREEFRRATAASPDNDVLFFNLGLIYRRNGLLDESRSAFERCHAINPRHLASASKPTAEAKIAEVAQEEKRVAAIETEIGAQAAAASGGAEAGSLPWHLAMAALLDARGEAAAARGHRLRALESPRPR